MSYIFLIAMLSSAPMAPESLTMFSRANCISFNESISWDGRGLTDDKWKFQLSTQSDQWFDTVLPSRTFVADWETTWRSYAGCNLCGSSGWTVVGMHFAYPTSDQRYQGLQEEVLDTLCPGAWEAGIGSGIECRISEAVDCNLGEV
jgi:hypothetical protein